MEGLLTIVDVRSKGWRRTLLVHGAVALMVLCAACGGATGRPSAPIPRVTEPLMSSAVFTLEAPGGYQAKLTLRRGVPVHAEPELTNGPAVLSPMCDVGSTIQSQAVEPFIATIQNESGSFPITPTMHLSVGGTPLPDGVEVAIDTYDIATASDSCSVPGLRDVEDPSLTGDIAAGRSITIYGFIVIGGYYSPTHPEGLNVQSLRGVTLIVHADNITPNPFVVTGAIGATPVSAGSGTVPLDNRP